MRASCHLPPCLHRTKLLLWFCCCCCCSALHFVAAIGSAKCCQLLIDAGADVNLQDREGYTPMHMAAGYMQTSAMQQLLEAGADPEIKDKTGRDCVTLVNNLRLQMPANPAVLQRRLALEQVANVLVDRWGGGGGGGGRTGPREERRGMSEGMKEGPGALAYSEI